MESHIVEPSLVLRKTLVGVWNGVEQDAAQQLIPETAVKVRNLGVVRWFARTVAGVMDAKHLQKRG